MKVSRPTPGNNNTDTQQSGPKLRNINDESDVAVEKPEGADIKLKIGAAVLLVLVVIMNIRGAMTKSSLKSQLAEAEQHLTEVKSEALLLGITEDEDGDLVIPEVEEPVDVADLDWDSIEARNDELLSSFTKELLNWEGSAGYTTTRNTLIETWEFKEDSRLLSSFMPDIENDEDKKKSIDTSTMSFNPKTNMQKFVLSNDGKNMSYFLICDVYNTIDGNTATGTVGIRMTINADGTISNVTVQTIAQMKGK